MRDAATPRATSCSRVTRARFSPSARLYSFVPRSSAWPSIRISVPGCVDQPLGVGLQDPRVLGPERGAIELEVHVAQPGRFLEVLRRGQRREHGRARRAHPRAAAPRAGPRRARAEACGESARIRRPGAGARGIRPGARGRVARAPGERQGEPPGHEESFRIDASCHGHPPCSRRRERPAPAGFTSATLAPVQPVSQSLENTTRRGRAAGSQGARVVRIVTGQRRGLSGCVGRLTVPRPPDRLRPGDRGSSERRAERAARSLPTA